MAATSQMRGLSNLYLFIYNSAQAIGWAVAFYRIIVGFLATKSFNGAYASSGDLVCLLQKVAFLEVIHGALGIVPSGVLLPLLQWGGKSHYLLAIIRNINEVQESPSIFTTFFGWCIGEFVRYSYYSLYCIGNCPCWSTFIRYTAFIPIYPSGLAGEMWLMYCALPYIKNKDLYGDLFSALPFSYSTVVQMNRITAVVSLSWSVLVVVVGNPFDLHVVKTRAILVCYPFLWLKLYMHLLKQRESKLRARHDVKRH